jgi:hypothetical protein
MVLFCILRLRGDDPQKAHYFINYMINNLPLEDRKTVSLSSVPGRGDKTDGSLFFFEAEDLIMVKKSRLEVFNPEADTVFATKEVSKAFLTFFEKYGRSVIV